MKDEINEYGVNETIMNTVMNGKFRKCLICDEEFQLGEKMVLCPIQGKKSGWATVMVIPLHSKCYWIEDELKGEK